MLDLLNGFDALVYDPRAGEWPQNVDINHSNDAVVNHGPNAKEGDSGSAVTVSSNSQLQGVSTQSLLGGEKHGKAFLTMLPVRGAGQLA
jgi:hypothetical protein